MQPGFKLSQIKSSLGVQTVVNNRSKIDKNPVKYDGIPLPVHSLGLNIKSHILVQYQLLTQNAPTV